MRFVAFYRNVNFGQRLSPSKAQFHAAFANAGAKEVGSFLTHGNALFSAETMEAARAISARASEELRQVCGLKEPAFIRTLAHLAELAAADPFAAAPKDNIHQQFATFLPDDFTAFPPVPLVTPRGDVEVFCFWQQDALSVNRMIEGKTGSVNALLEKVLAIPATTRNFNTVLRIVRQESRNLSLDGKRDP